MAAACTDAPPSIAGPDPVSSTGMRRPRPWAAPLARPAARIALAGGLTVAGWLLGALVAGAGAEAAEQPHVGDASGSTVVTAPDRHGEAHRAHHHADGRRAASTRDSAGHADAAGGSGHAAGWSS